MRCWSLSGREDAHQIIVTSTAKITCNIILENKTQYLQERGNYKRDMMKDQRREVKRHHRRRLWGWCSKPDEDRYSLASGRQLSGVGTHGTVATLCRGIRRISRRPAQSRRKQCKKGRLFLCNLLTVVRYCYRNAWVLAVGSTPFGSAIQRQVTGKKIFTGIKGASQKRVYNPLTVSMKRKKGLKWKNSFYSVALCSST